MIEWTRLEDLYNELKLCREYDSWMREWLGNPSAPTPPLKPVLYNSDWKAIDGLLFYYMINEKGLWDGRE